MSEKAILDAINGLAERMDKMEAKFDGMDEKIDNMDAKFTKAIEETKDTLRGEIQENGNTLRSEMQEMGDTLRGEMQEMGKTLRDEMQVMGKNLKKEIVEKIRADIGMTEAQLKNEIKSNGDLISQHTKEITNELSNRIDQNANTIVNQINRVSELEIKNKIEHRDLRELIANAV